MILKKFAKSVLLGGMATMFFTMTVLAASESLNHGGATWSGGISGSGYLYSKVVDNKDDGVIYKVCVFVKNDEKDRDSYIGITRAVGEKGKVEITKKATYEKPFTPNKVGYEDLICLAEKK